MPRCTMPQGLEDSYFLLFICFCCVEFVSLYFLLFGSTFMAFSSTYCSCFFCFCLILLYAFVLNDGCFHRLSEQSFYPLLQLFFSLLQHYALLIFLTAYLHHLSNGPIMFLFHLPILLFLSLSVSAQIIFFFVFLSWQIICTQNVARFCFHYLVCTT